MTYVEKIFYFLATQKIDKNFLQNFDLLKYVQIRGKSVRTDCIRMYFYAFPDRWGSVVVVQYQSSEKCNFPRFRFRICQKERATHNTEPHYRNSCIWLNSFDMIIEIMQKISWWEADIQWQFAWAVFDKQRVILPETDY